MAQHTYGVWDSATSYKTTCGEHPEALMKSPAFDPVALLEGGMGAQLRQQNVPYIRISLGEHPGLEYTETITDEVKIYHRTYFTDRNVLMLVVGGLQAVKEEEKDRFFNSLSVNTSAVVTKHRAADQKHDDLAVCEAGVSVATYNRCR